MKTKLFLFTLLTAFFLSALAQVNKPVKDPVEITFNGYVIRVFQTPDHGYGYNIFYNDALILHQDVNPYNQSPAGIKLKEDAVKTAKWQVIHFPLAKKPQQIQRQVIPMEVARQLNITID